ncbi:3'(2'),5'-bisphosphate nucleotidase CysQ [Zunongwangia sp. F363]|uniref:3'(2'),5'-bisphosphate nucleotidase CysQ n=1 Tax=Autumnicola tepida TaxID=3075595 RepID=A0ABU3C7P8_9FLAO|nr:3'(2'),5'-bisphosphate nucleotidase CysQ [Zunongwangia sp. F363]MDT0642298.1 3'(2'),5'-bisphosphate nucleotidase CysQ [Zunongwangia sp. F363]
MDPLLETAIRASVEAGKKILEVYEQEDFGIQQKTDNSPLTKADMAAHNTITSFLDKTGIPVLSEEGKHAPYAERKKWPRLWIVDPLDGTKEFIKRNGEFTVNIALIEDLKPILGVIYVPVLKQLYFAEKETGSFMVEDISETTNIEEITSEAKKLPIAVENKEYTVVASKSHLSAETEEYISSLKKMHGEVKVVSKGSSLKLCMVAEAKADVYPRFGPTMEWDTAAGHAICTFAGKTLTDYESGEEMLYNREELKNGWFLVK